MVRFTLGFWNIFMRYPAQSFVIGAWSLILLSGCIDNIPDMPQEETLPFSLIAAAAVTSIVATVVCAITFIASGILFVAAVSDGDDPMRERMFMLWRTALILGFISIFINQSSWNFLNARWKNPAPVEAAAETETAQAADQ